MLNLFLLFSISSLVASKQSQKPNRTIPKQNLHQEFVLYSITPTGHLESQFTGLNSLEELKDLPLAVVDCIENKYYCKDHGVTEFPAAQYTTIKQVIPYTWDFTIQDLREFAVKMAGDDSVTVYKKEIADKFSSVQSAFILFFNPEIRGVIDLGYVEDFRRIARKYRHTHVYMGTCHAGEVADYLRVDKHDLPVLMQIGTDTAYAYNISEPLTQEAMEDFIENHRCTMKLKVSKGYWAEALDCFKGRVVGFSFHEGSKLKNTQNPGHFNMFVKKLRDNKDFRFQFAHVDVEEFRLPAEVFGVTSFPDFVVADYRRDPPVFNHFGEIEYKNYTLVMDIIDTVWEGQSLNKIREGLGINQGSCGIQSGEADRKCSEDL